MRQFRYTTLVLVLLALGTQAEAQTDTTAVRKELRRTMLDYERSLRRFAPYRMGSNSGSYCDEVVGRFCLVYDAGVSSPLPEEPKRITESRERAVQAYRVGMTVWPADTLVAGPLVRFLIEGGKTEEAVSAADRFAEASRDSVWPWLLRGFALNAHAAIPAAEAAFDSALARMRASESEDWKDARYLLGHSERPRYRELRGDARADYEGRLWRLADPLYLTPGNETRAEHMSRQVYGRILRRAPVVTGSWSWAEDLDELTTRFGVPRARTQDYARSLELQITEYYDPYQLTYVPPEMTVDDGVALFEPGGSWPYDTIRARSGYAPATVRRMRVLEHQLSRFPVGDSTVLRADLSFPLDTAVTRPAHVELGLFVLDSAFRPIAHVRDTVSATSDTLVAVMALALPEGAAAYSLEARELGSRLAARGRYMMPLPLLARPSISDLVLLPPEVGGAGVTRSSATFQPLPSLRIRRNGAVALYMEARGLIPNNERMVNYRVDLEVLEHERKGALGRAVTRLGRALGIAGEDATPRITWTELAPSAAFIPIALKLGQLQLDPGLKRFRVTVTDLDSGFSAAVDRLVRIEK